MKKISILILSLVLVFKFDLKAQNGVQRVIPSSPIASLLGVYGQIPVSMFTGVPSVEIPLGNVSIEDVSIPIAMNYYGGGVRPDNHASWTGVGFNLFAGGVITRRTNGQIDEMENVELIRNPPVPDLLSYYKNFGELNNEQWFTKESIVKYMTTVPAKDVRPLPGPDEFIFNFGGYTGSFLYDHYGKWQVKSESPLKLSIQEETASDFKYPGLGYIFSTKRTFYKFTIVTPDGTNYIFGGSPEAVEFTATGTFNNSSGYNPEFNSTAWYLSKIITRNGKEVNFKYESDGLTKEIQETRVLSSYNLGNQAGASSSSATDNLSLITGSYLSEIVAPNQIIKFYRSKSTELEGPTANSSTVHPSRIPLLQYLTNGSVKEFKLDSISFQSNKVELKKIIFSYTQNTSSRLFLERIQQKGQDGQYNSPYKFFYNPIVLPKYNSGETDHWGFYNANKWSDNASGYFERSREPNPDYMQAGILTSIVYPTGGSTQFEYEPHRYSNIVKRSDPLYELISTSNTDAGGVRIRKITHNDGISKENRVVEYFYVKDYQLGGTKSSGILAGIPVYTDAGATDSYNYSFTYSFPVEQLSFTNGNHITYSEVVEKK
ncbi:hypothetical protein TH53_10350 [Pedobacter lusitanus]|uniref:Uncharacterized protein n=1 Tax=Pedobacter lusitanus TaxID=1503925 RepID=A0A0D0GJ13_9SPHI|nr:hypothetical protein [Pedobacter lusitanus]KIO77242.1 hypothetical protein TH53_10350 [Pedobacter lusitanus]